MKSLCPTILYGSETGTAEAFAYQIFDNLRSLQISCKLCCALNSYPSEKLPFEQMVIFVCSTTGSGQEPENMKTFWKELLRKSFPDMPNLKFGVLALGDSSYEKFNFVGKRLYRRLLQLKANSIVSLGLADDQHDFGPDQVFETWNQGPLTLAQIVEKVWDLQRVPSRNFLKLLSNFATDEQAKERLWELGTKLELYDEYLSYCVRPKRSILEVFQDFPQITRAVPLEYLFDLVPVIQPRAFSIASSYKEDPFVVEILVAVVNYKTNLVRPRKGLCSNWLTELKAGAKVELSVKSGSLVFPCDTTIPCILIGPGTGVAPFRSFIREQILFSKKENGPSGSICLFFGCRSKNGDFYFENEWSDLQKMVSETELLRIFVAFSRDQERKIYVQHLMQDNRQFVGDMIAKKASIFLAGNAKQMPEDVKEAIKDIVHSLNLHSNPAQFLEQMFRAGKFQCETWS